MNLIKKVTTCALVVSMACLLVPPTAEAHCQCIMNAESTRRTASGNCRTILAAGGVVICGGLFTLGALPGIGCGLVFVWLDSQCTAEAERDYNEAVATCRATYPDECN